MPTIDNPMNPKTRFSSGTPTEARTQRKTATSRGSAVLPPPFARLIDEASKTQEIEMLRISQVKLKTGQAVSTIWLAVKNGAFPPPVKISSRSVAWVKAEVNAVLSARLLLSRNALNVDMSVFVAELISARQPREGETEIACSRNVLGKLSDVAK